MTARITSLAIRSSPNFRCSASRSAFRYTNCTHAKPSRWHSTAVGQMLAKANRDFEANGPPPKNTLSKQLFPSSSPTPSSSDIRDQLKKRGGLAPFALSPSSGKGPQHTSKPLDDRPTNTSFNSGNGIGRGSLASLYGNNGSSFKNPESLIDLTASDDTPTNKMTESVYFAEDDFSDDDGLDLEFQVPKSLPALPAEKSPAKENLPPSSSSKLDNAIPWSSSPATHFLPPQPLRSTSQTSTTSLKRESSGEKELPDAPSQKPVKRRKLPQSFQSGPDAAPAPVATPKPKVHDMWDPTASATKEQKRQLKRERNVAAKASVTGFAKDEETTFQKSGDMTDSGSALPKSDTVTLSSEQRHVLNMVVEQGKSVFFTGPAGTGKSVLMRAIIQELRNKYARDSQRVAVTASTGLAACNIGGVTLHSFAGVGLGKEPANALVKKVRRNPKAKNRWLATKCLIIDEISMVDGELFDKLSQVGRTIRNNGRPWGGIQLIVTGDFLQLPPVPDMDKKREPNFAFDAKTWDTSIDHTIGLTQVFRQRDPEFAQMLNEMRLGKISDKTVQAFKALSRPLKFDDGVDSAELFPTRNQVEYSNQSRLRELPGKPYRYDAADAGKEDRREKLLSNMMAPKSIELKLDAQVMLIKNLDDTLVNGSLGKVIGFSDEKTFSMDTGVEEAEMDDMAKARQKLSAFARDSSSEKSGPKFPVVQFVSTNGSQRVILCQPEEWKVELPNGEVEAKRSQIPLILAWALSIHKAQGQTLDRVTVNLGRVFEHGQAYVALSRATTKNGLRVLGFERSKVMAHHRVVEFYKKLYSAADVSGVPASTIMDLLDARRGVAQKPVKTISIDDDAEEAMAAHGY